MERSLASEVRKYSSHPINVGVHQPAINAYSGFRPDLLAASNDFLSMHAYSIYYSGTEHDDPLNSDVVPVACLVTEALGHKPVLFEEFGYASSEHGDVSLFKPMRRGAIHAKQYFADDVAGGCYYQQVLDKLAVCGAIGAFAWMFSDYDPKIWDKPPLDTHEHERFFGLTRFDGTVKPSGEAMRRFSKRIEANELPPRSVGPLELDPAAWYEDPRASFDRVFRQWKGRIG